MLSRFSLCPRKLLYIESLEPRSTARTHIHLAKTSVKTCRRRAASLLAALQVVVLQLTFWREGFCGRGPFSTLFANMCCKSRSTATLQLSLLWKVSSFALVTTVSALYEHQERSRISAAWFDSLTSHKLMWRSQLSGFKLHIIYIFTIKWSNISYLHICCDLSFVANDFKPSGLWGVFLHFEEHVSDGLKSAGQMEL